MINLIMKHNKKMNNKIIANFNRQMIKGNKIKDKKVR